jgi:hypothetical protein
MKRCGMLWRHMQWSKLGNPISDRVYEKLQIVLVSNGGLSGI